MDILGFETGQTKDGTRLIKENKNPGNPSGSDTSVLDDLDEVLRDRCCKRVLVVRHSPKNDTSLKKLGARCRPPSRIEITTPSAWLERPCQEPRYSIGIVWDFPFPLSNAGSERLLARLRDLDCEAVYVRCVAQRARLKSWSGQLRALGFMPLKKRDEHPPLFYFDIYDYKRVPDWLNSRFWANPHMWNKARW